MQWSCKEKLDNFKRAGFSSTGRVRGEERGRSPTGGALASLLAPILV